MMEAHNHFAAALMQSGATVSKAEVGKTIG